MTRIEIVRIGRVPIDRRPTFENFKSSGDNQLSLIGHVLFFICQWDLVKL